MFRKQVDEGSSHVTLGKTYREEIHGIEGVAVSKHIYITGCDRVTIEWLVGGDIKSASFDATQLSEVQTGTPIKTERKRGGPGFVPAPKS